MNYYEHAYLTVKSKGKPIPTNDLWIGATALQHGFAVFSFDGHFRHINGLIVGRQSSNFLP